MAQDFTPTWPDFNVTVIHGRHGVEYVHATVEGRLCNVAYSDGAYMAGERKPRYPMPATELDNAIAAPAERLQFRIKAMLLRDKATLRLTGYG